MKKKKIISLILITFVITTTIFLNLKSNEQNINNIKNLIIRGFKPIKVTSDKTSIDYNKLKFSINMPVVEYEDKDIERYINSYIRKNINEFINKKKQEKDLAKKYRQEKIDINYHIIFEDRNILNLVVYKDTYIQNGKKNREKDSYVFDLKTGQRIYLDNFLKNNNNYSEKIKDYILKNRKNLKLNKRQINIDKNTNYYITDDGIVIYFNPNQINNKSYEFKIPSEIFDKKIKCLETNPIEAQIDTQTITKNTKYLNSIINIPIILTENKKIEKNINQLIETDIMDGYYKAENEAKKFLQDSPNEEISPHIYNVDFDIKKNSDSMLSIVIKIYQYSGGAHGAYENKSYNIFIQDGNNLSLQDLFNKDVNYKEVINEIIRQQIKENKYDYSFKSISENQKFYIQDNQLVIYFDLYEIAPFAGGIPEFRIDIDDIKHILNKKYIDVFK